MSIASYRGVVRGKKVVLDDDMDLPDGTGVVVTPVERGAGCPGAVLTAAKAPPHLTQQETVEFLRGIEDGKRPVRYDNPLTGSPRNREP